MKLAIFTPTAALQPVLRNFDVFIASLGAPRADAGEITGSVLYPLELQEMLPRYDAELERRLGALHTELYTALLRPSEVFAKDQRSMADTFWPDLRGTSIGDLLEAFFYYFLRRVEGDVSVIDGLSVLRAVFFNHAASDPTLWVYSAEQRLTAARLEFPLLRVEVPAPVASRWQDLTFVVNARKGASPAGDGWFWGSLRRRPDGRVLATCECGVDPSIAGTAREHEAAQRVQQRLCATLDRIFGWQRIGAAA
jgi:hypothetical protein